MRAVVQRVSRARVDVGAEVVGAIDEGLMVLIAAGEGDSQDDALYMARKIADLRIFEDPDGKMNLSVKDTAGSVLLISQFTLYGDCRKGRRPSFVHAMKPPEAEHLVDAVADALRKDGLRVETGEFGANMDVHLVNRGPVTLMLDSQKNF